MSPTAVTAWASRAEQIIRPGSLGEIGERLGAAGIPRTATIIVGRRLGF